MPVADWQKRMGSTTEVNRGAAEYSMLWIRESGAGFASAENQVPVLSN